MGYYTNTDLVSGHTTVLSTTVAVMFLLYTTQVTLANKGYEMPILKHSTVFVAWGFR